jgi:predicted nucleic acid-binding protein
MSKPRKLYWDSSCFICFLNGSEKERRLICEDILQCASAGEVEIWYSMWVVVEVIRPKKPGNAPLPDWALKAIKAVPESKPPLEELWKRYQRSSPSQKLTPKQIQMMQGMFQWPFLKPIYIDQRIAEKAVEIARDKGLKPGDAVHAAAAIITKCDVIQRWDKDYDKVADLIPSEEPQRISPQGVLDLSQPIGPTPEDFEDDQPEETKPTVTNPSASEVQGGSDGSTGNPTGTPENSQKAGKQDYEAPKRKIKPA